ncbi:unnamed protein product [marine sediment metagenome]|uniref:Uncharacterized protein n=1 Tax=marine sediment metagenome TaxID=412755 RepID=X1AMH8_9ZZZZ
MVFSKSIIDIIKERTSWRTYSDQLLEEEFKEKVIKIFQLKDFKSPFSEFAEKCRFELIGVIAGTISFDWQFILLEKRLLLKNPPNQHVPKPKSVADNIMDSIR